MMLADPELDQSGWTPGALWLLTDVAARMPYEEAALVATNFGLTVSKSELERLTAPVAGSCREGVMACLHETPSAEPSETRAARVMVLEVDGVMVLEKPEAGSCRGIEIKTVTLYPLESPSQRLVIADVRTPQELQGAIKGLLQRANLSPQDTLVGLGDGAVWVQDLLDTFCSLSITDCFHAAAYLETVMLALGWPERDRIANRKRLCKGEIDVGAWLATHLPAPEVWLLWQEEAVKALRYLEDRVRRMHYPHFKGLGFPIGSGVVEGLNKSVIGTRMKRSGMQWSRPGAARMAALRAWVTSKRKLVDFDTIRHLAYPPPSPEALTLSA